MTSADLKEILKRLYAFRTENEDAMTHTCTYLSNGTCLHPDRYGQERDKGMKEGLKYKGGINGRKV